MIPKNYGVFMSCLIRILRTVLKNPELRQSSLSNNGLLAGYSMQYRS